MDAGDQTDVSVLFDLQKDIEIALSALHIAVLMKKKVQWYFTAVSASYWFDEYFTIKERVNSPRRENGRS